MSRLIFILGNPGTGKSSSLRNLTKEDVSYINVTGKDLPFRTTIKPVLAKDMPSVVKMVNASIKPIVVIDDTNYLFTRGIFGAKENDNKFDTYDKISKDFYNIIQAILDKDTDQNYYLLGHLEDSESSTKMLKTLGQNTRKNNNPEGWTNIVFESVIDLGEFVFRVKTDGSGVKSPMEMFDSTTIDNDLKIVNDKINEYYNVGEEKSSNES
jgi:hypothetical protein